MDHTLSFQIALWLWIALSATGVTGFFVMVIMLLDDFQPYMAAIASLFALAAAGLLFFSLSLFGVPVAATWAWRILAGIACASGLLSFVNVLSESSDSDVGEILSILGATVLAGALFVTGILTAPRPFAPRSPALAPPAAAGTTVYQIDVWHTFTMTILALTTLTFLSLFLLAMRRGIPLAVESRWGGLGGGITGWEISKSLSYLIGVIVFGVLFSLFLLREEKSSPPRVAATSAKEAAAQPSSNLEPKSDADTGTSVSVPPQATRTPRPVAK